MPRNSLAVVTGASTGIGYELAKCCVQDGFDLLIAADEDKINQAADNLRAFGTNVTGLNVDLATRLGVDKLVDALQGRPVDALLANAGRGLGRAFLDQDFDAARRVVDTNITGTIYLIHRIGRQMRDAGHGRILITGSIAGSCPAPIRPSITAQKHSSIPSPLRYGMS
jgi:short-subunit dehydrogenase